MRGSVNLVESKFDLEELEELIQTEDSSSISREYLILGSNDFKFLEKHSGQFYNLYNSLKKEERPLIIFSRNFSLLKHNVKIK